MNIYGLACEDRLADALDRVGEVVLPVKRSPVEHQQVVGAETKIATLLGTESCNNKEWWSRANGTSLLVSDHAPALQVHYTTVRSEDSQSSTIVA